MAEQPAMSSDVQHLRQSFINGDHDMMLDLQGLLHEKSPRLSWRDCSALHTAHRNQSARAAAQVTGNNSIVSVDATMLEHSEFALFRQKFESDLALMEVYRSKVSSHSSLLYHHHRLEHMKRRRVQASEAVDVMFQNGCPPRFAFCIANQPGNAVGFLKDHSEEILRAENVRPNTPLAIMVVVNWAAPSTNSAGAMAVQDPILSAVLNGNNCDTLGVVFTPVWERKQGLLYKAESMVLDRIANANINCDERAVLSFEQRPRQRQASSRIPDPVMLPIERQGRGQHVARSPVGA